MDIKRRNNIWILFIKVQIFYKFNINDITFFERENSEQVVNEVHGGGSSYSLWTGTQKARPVYSTEKTVGNKATLLYVDGGARVDVKLNFSYDDFSVINKLLQ